MSYSNIHSRLTITFFYFNSITYTHHNIHRKWCKQVYVTQINIPDFDYENYLNSSKAATKRCRVIGLFNTFNLSK
jgi:hypothetical protein